MARQKSRGERTRRSIEETGSLELSSDREHAPTSMGGDELHVDDQTDASRERRPRRFDDEPAEGARGNRAVTGDVHGRQPTERDRRATDETEAADMPKEGETYRCERCGMVLEVTADCHCAKPEQVHLECCGQELVKA
jgi:hypothetical protein